MLKSLIRFIASTWRRVNRRFPIGLIFIALPSIFAEKRHSPVTPWFPFSGYPIGSRANGKEIVMLTISNLRIDPRIEREARALAKAGYTVTVIAPDPRLQPDEPISVDWGIDVNFDWIDPGAITFPWEWPGFIGREFYNVAITKSPFAFHAHDLFTAFIGLSVAKKTGAHLVCDFHEWGSENVKWSGWAKKWKPYPWMWKGPLKWLERRCFRDASEIITVCDSIADAMAEESGSGRRAVVVRNIPALDLKPTKKYPPLRKQIKVAKDQFILLWQGGTGPTRLIEPIIEALALAPRCTFVIRGPSLDIFGDEYKEIAERIGATDRLILLPPVPSRDVVSAAHGADAGIWSLPDLCRNFRLALPNKIFEYLASGLPILVADYPEARKIALELKVGLTFDPYDPHSIAKSINQLIDDSEETTRMQDAIPGALKALDATNEWAKLADIYDKLPKGMSK